MKKMLLSIVISLCAISLVGCDKSSSTDASELKSQLSELKEENQSLKAEIKSLKSSNSETSNDTNKTKDTVASNNETISNLSKEEEYIKDKLSLNSANVSLCDGYDGKEPGLRDISIKNSGDKDIDELTVTVYFQDTNGKDIAENSFMIIGGYFGGDTLKANYSWKMESDEYYPIENLSEEVDISKNRVEITEIKFGH